jgi:UDP-N-acetylmuramate: L-alanyl-gamma-D-glutamyl-meso-diaminopimelate ligase
MTDAILPAARHQAPVTTNSLDIHLIAIGGTGMAPLACLLKEQGHRVGGSDQPLYPPMSTLLSDAGITPLVGYDPVHLDPTLDLVVIGNALPRSNPEALEVERLGLDHMSMPQALSHFFLGDRRPLVIAGTHGKTTTTSLAAWVYTDCETDPGYLIGGVPIDLGQSFQRGTGERFIIEGDEYNAAYFDRGPKFLHYQPETLILTSVEYDHADLYPDPGSLIRVYEQLVAIVPDHGLLIAYGDSPEVRSVASHANSKTVFYGVDPGNDVQLIRPIETTSDGSRFRIRDSGVFDSDDRVHEIRLSLAGEHNALNAVAVWIAARSDGIDAATVARALGRFRGVRRRQEELGTRSGVTVLDDFAHHPTAISKTLEALRQRYPDRRLVAVFEPRSLTAGRSFFFDAYLEAFGYADRVYVAPVFHAARLGPEERLDVEALVERLTAAGTETSTSASIDELLESIVAESNKDDLIVTMSSGSFDNLPNRLLDTL